MLKRDGNFECDKNYKLKFCLYVKEMFEKKGAKFYFEIPEDPQAKIDIYATAVTKYNKTITYAIELKDRDEYEWDKKFANTEGWVIEDDKIKSGKNAMDFSGYTHFIYGNIFHFPTPKLAIWKYPFSYGIIPEKQYHKTTVGTDDRTYKKVKKGLLNKDAKWYNWYEGRN